MRKVKEYNGFHAINKNVSKTWKRKLEEQRKMSIPLIPDFGRTRQVINNYNKILDCINIENIKETIDEANKEFERILDGIDVIIRELDKEEAERKEWLRKAGCYAKTLIREEKDKYWKDVITHRTQMLLEGIADDRSDHKIKIKTEWSLKVNEEKLNIARNAYEAAAGRMSRIEEMLAEATRLRNALPYTVLEDGIKVHNNPDAERAIRNENIVMAKNIEKKAWYIKCFSDKKLRESLGDIVKCQRFWCKQFQIADFMSEKQLKLWLDIQKAKTGYEVQKALHALHAYLEAHKAEGYHVKDINRQIPWRNMPEEQVIRALGVKPGEYTEAIKLMDFDVIFQNTYRKEWKSGVKAKKEQLDALGQQMQELSHMAYTRAMTKGFKVGDGEMFLPYDASAGQAKKGSSYCIDRSVIVENRDLFWVGGLTLDTIEAGGGWNLSRMDQVRALVFSSSVPMARLYNQSITARNIIIVQDITITIKGNFVLVKVVNGKYVTEEVDHISFKVTDGGGITFAPEYRGLFAQMRVCAGGKGTIQYFDVMEYARKKGYKMEIEDIYGKVWDLNVETQINTIVPKSVIKIADFFKSMEAYWQFCERQPARYGFNECHIMATAEEHPSRKQMTRQSLQMLPGMTIDGLRVVAEPQLRALDDLRTKEGAENALRAGEEGFCAVMRKLPDCEQLPIAQAYLTEKDDQMFRDIAMGKIGTGYMGMSSYDPTAAIDVWLGHKDPDKEKVGVLKAGEIAWRPMQKYREVCLVRYPVNGMNKITSMKIRAWKDLPHNGMVFSFYSAEVSFMDGDHDGDHWLAIMDEPIILQAKRLHDLYPNVIYDAGTPGYEAWPTPMPRNGYQLGKLMAGARVIAYYNNKIGSDSDGITRLCYRIADEAKLFDETCVWGCKAQRDVDSTKTFVSAPELDFDDVKLVLDQDSEGNWSMGLMPMSDIFTGREYVMETRISYKGQEYKVKTLVPWYDFGYWFGSANDGIEPKVSNSTAGTVNMWANHMVHMRLDEAKREGRYAGIVNEQTWKYAPKYELTGGKTYLMKAEDSSPIGQASHLLNTKLTKQVKAEIMAFLADMDPQDKRIQRVKKDAISYVELAELLVYAGAAQVDKINALYDDDHKRDAQEAIKCVNDLLRTMLIKFVSPRANGIMTKYDDTLKARLAADALVRAWFGLGKNAPKDRVNKKTPDIIAGNSFKGIFFLQRTLLNLFSDEICQTIDENMTRAQQQKNMDCDMPM